jgi:tetratricopeptide (TPR) repeat protein/serine/threonine protein kinase
MSEQSSDPDPLLPLAEEFAERYRQGERPTLTEYADRHPALAERIRRLFPTLVVIEEFGSVAGEPTGPFGMASGSAPPQLGEYRLLREVGRGGMGIVYEAVQESLGRHVALKVLTSPGLLSPTQLQRFEREAKAAARLHHTNIVPVYGVGEADGVHYYAMQFIHGRSADIVLRELRQLRQIALGGPADEPTTTVTPSADSEHEPDAPAKEDGDFSLARQSYLPPSSGISELSGRSDAEYFRSVARVGVQAAEALAHAHTQGVLHRDIKPANLLIDPQGTVWVTDFGLAKVEGSDDLTREGEVPGTLRYMAPERFAGQADARSDIYSLGLTLYELLTLRPAFTVGDRAALVEQILHAEPARPRALASHVPRDLEAIILKALAKEPVERYQTAQELADDLRRFLEDLPVHARRSTVLQRLRKWTRRHRAVVWSIAVCLLAAALALTGSIGWTLHDRAVQQELVKDQVESPLRDAWRFLEEARWAEAGLALDKAQALRARGGTDEQRQRNEALLNDLHMAKTLETIRLRQAQLLDDQREQTEQSYAQAFRDYGIDLDTLRPDEAAEQLRSRSIRGALVAALDDWAATRWGLAEFGDRRDLRWQHLLAVARAADPDEGRNRIRDALERKDTKALKDLAVAYGAVAGARQAGEKAGSLPAQTVVFFCDALLMAGALDIALSLEWQARELQPGDFWLNYNLAVLLHRNEELDAAIRFYTAALALRPDTAMVHASLGTALLLNGARDEGLAAIRKAIDLDPNLATAHNNLGNVLGEMGDPVGEVFHLRKAIELEPKLSGVYTNLGAALHHLADLDAAVGALSSPRAPLTGVAFTRARLDAALAAYSKGLKIRPGSPDAHFNRGLLLAKLGKFKEAAEDFRKATEGDRGFTSAYLHLGDTLEKQGEFDEAETAFRQAVTAGAQSGQRLRGPSAIARSRRVRPAEAHFSLGRILWKQKKLREAEAAFRAAIGACTRAADLQDIEVQHDVGRCLRFLGRVLAEQGQNDTAEAAFRDAIAVFTEVGHMRLTEFQAGVLRHDVAQTYDVLGDALAAQSKYKDAKAAYGEALPGLTEPEAADTYSRLADVLRKQNLPTDAERLVRKCLELYRHLEHDYPSVPEFKDGLAGALHDLALDLRNRYQFADARRHMEEAIDKQQAALDAVKGRNARYRKRLWTHYWGLAEILGALKDHAAVAQAVEHMPRIDPDDWEPCYRASFLLAQCTGLADKDDKLPPAERTRLHQSYVGRVRALLTEALKRIDTAKPQTDDQRRKLAEGAIAVGDGFGAVHEMNRVRQSYEKAVVLCPQLAVAHLKLGNILSYQREWLPAAAAFDQAITLRPESAEAHEGRAMTFAALGQIEDAVAAYRRAGEFYKDKAQAARLYINFGEFLARNHRLPEAEDEFRKAVQLQPKLEGAHYSLGLALGQQGKTKEAIVSFRKAVEINADYAAAWGNLGFALKKEGQIKEALKALKEAERLLPAADPTRPKIEAVIRECERLIESKK